MSTASAAGTGSVTLIPEAYRHIVNPAVLGALTVWDKAARAETTLYVATRGFVSSPSDDPANTIFYERLLESGSVSQDLFDAVTTSGRSRYGVGNATLNNADHGLDDWLTSYAFDGRVCEFWYGDLSRPFPDGWTKIFHGTMLPPDADESTISLNFRDAQAKLDAPLQTTRYAGTNVLPNGLEGTADDLKGKPKPVCLGNVFNIAPPCVNTSKLIYQVNDGAVDSISVKDGGVVLSNSISTFAAYATGTGLTTVRNVVYATYGDGVWVIVGAGSGNHISTSDDGLSWTSRHDMGGNGNAVGYGDGLIMAVGADGVVATSNDGGATWTDRDASAVWGVGDHLDGIAYVGSKGRWLAVSGTGIVGYSDDRGATWTTALTSGKTALTGCLAYGMNYGVFGANDGTIYRSTDQGASWTSVATPFSGTSPLEQVMYANGLFVASGITGQIFVSVDGKNWNGRNSGVAETMSAGTFIPNLGWILFGNGRHLQSVDTVSWVSFDAPQAPYGMQEIASNDDGSLTLMVGAYSGTSGAIAYTDPASGYSTLTDLEDDEQAPAAGTYRVALTTNGSYLRLGSPPAGQITADVVQGSASSDRTAGQLFVQVAQKAGLSAGDWSASDIVDLDNRDSSEIGYWSGLNDVTCASVADQLLSSVVGWWGADDLGVLRVGTLDDPTSATESVSLTERDVDAPNGHTTLRRIRQNDSNQGVPSYRIVVRFNKNWSVQGSGIFGVVSQVDRERLANEYLEYVLEDDDVQAAHPLSLELKRETLISGVADATEVAARLQDLFGFEGEAFTFDTEFHVNKRLRVGKVLRLTNPYYGLSAGERFVLLGLETRPTEVPPTSTWTIWRPRSTSRATASGSGSVTATIGTA